MVKHLRLEKMCENYSPGMLKHDIDPCISCTVLSTLHSNKEMMTSLCNVESSHGD